MSHKRPSSWGNPDHRRQTQFPAPPIAQIEQQLWGKTWYYYLTNVQDPQLLSPQQVCDLYRCRWRVEEAFLLTKRASSG
jgi:hypothetical protein